LNVLDPFADPVRRPWPTTGMSVRPPGPPRSVTSPVTGRSEEETNWYVSPTAATRIRHGKRGSIFMEDI
jgi:hypothetical protein